MLASRAFAIACVADLAGSGTAPEAPRIHPLIRALGPALETAFGIEHETLFPDEIAALVVALQAGPLGTERVSRETHPAARCLEPA